MTWDIQPIYGVDASTEPKSTRIDAKRRLAKPGTIQKARSKLGSQVYVRIFWVGLQAYDAPERTVACSALLPDVLTCMSAFELLIAGRRVYGFIP